MIAGGSIEQFKNSDFSNAGQLAGLRQANGQGAQVGLQQNTYVPPTNYQFYWQRFCPCCGHPTQGYYGPLYQQLPYIYCQQAVN